MSQKGNSSKPISVYANGNIEHPVKSSSAGLKINVANFTLDIGLGLDNIGVSGSLKNGNSTNSLGLKLNLSEFELGFEGSTAIQWDDNNSEVSYNNISVNGVGMIMVAKALIFDQPGLIYAMS